MLFLDNGLPSPETTETTETVPSLGADQSSRSCAAADAAFSLAVVVVSLRKMHTMEVGDIQITTTKIAQKTSIKTQGIFHGPKRQSLVGVLFHFLLKQEVVGESSLKGIIFSCFLKSPFFFEQEWMLSPKDFP